jgi:gamma-tubulin complex component 4
MFTRILFVCHKVFFHQINAWIVHGQLVDISQEFFIHKLEQAKEPEVVRDDAKSELNRTASHNLFQSVMVKSNENFGDSDQNRDDEWNTLFSLRLSMLPSSYISASLAQKILFIGKAVKVLQSKRTSSEDRVPDDELQCFSEAIDKLQKLPQFNVLLFSKVIEEIRECIASRLWHLTVIKANLLDDLKAIKDYFLLAKGEFF